MKILIGTPIHMIKDYCMERWLDNVSEIQYPFFLLLVDNSPGTDYVERVNSYCQKLGIKNYEIKHLEINQALGADERIGHSREIIRQFVLDNNYDSWFSWECDQIIPTDSIGKLIDLMEKGNYLLVSHGSPSREIPDQSIASFGISLIKKEVLTGSSFLLNKPTTEGLYHAGEDWLKKNILKEKGNYIEVYGIINPIYHLNK